MIESLGSQENSAIKKQETVKEFAQEDPLIEVFQGYFYPVEKEDFTVNLEKIMEKSAGKELQKLIKKQYGIQKKIESQCPVDTRITLHELLTKALKTYELTEKLKLDDEIRYPFLDIGRIGRQSLAQDIYNEIPSACNTSDDKQNKSLQHLVNINTFIDAGEMIIRIAGVSLSDLLNKEKSSVISFTQLFEFLVESYAIRYGVSKKVNIDRLSSEYPIEEAPSWTLFYRAEVAKFVTNVTPFHLKEINKIETGATGLKRQLAKQTKELMQHIQNLHEKAYKIALDPSQPEFQEFKSALMPYLQKNDSYRTALVLSLGINTLDKMFYAYRKASALRKGAYPQFYSLLASSIYVLAKQLRSAGFSVVTQDELEKIGYNNDASYTSFSPLWMQEVIHSIAQISNKRITPVYQPDLRTINWQGLKPADKIKLEFNRNNLYQCSLIFVWKNPDQKNTIEVKFIFDTKKHHFFWNVLDTPSQALPFFCPFTFIIPATLFTILDQINTTASQKKEKQRPVEKYDYKKEGMPSSVSTNFSFDEERNIPIDNSKDPIKDRIKLLDNKQRTRLTSKLPSYLKERVNQTLERYYQEGGAGIKKLETTKSDKKPLYALRIGNIRLLLSEDKSSPPQGARSFQIEDIDFRKDIYRRIFRR